jgi:DNA-binding XRE family transcriptional regulator
MSEPVHRIKKVKLKNNGIQVRFRDGLAGELSFEELDLDTFVREIDRTHLKATDGREVKFIYENEEQEVFPWDFFRYELDEEYRYKQQKTRRKELEKLGRRVRQFRKARGINQTDLASRAGIGRTTLSRLENGKQFPRFQTLMSIASALDISFQKLMIAEDTNFNKTALAQ